MKNFEYVAARSVAEAVEALNTCDGIARPIAGGTDLIVQLAEGRRSVDRLVGLERIERMHQVSVEPDGWLALGAAAPCAAVYSNLAVRTRYPMLAEAAKLIGSVQIQSRASIGGNLCNAAPSADSVPALICLDAEAVVEGPGGVRRAPVSEFCTGPGQTLLAPGELLVELRIPPPSPREGGCYLRFIPRNEMDIAVAGAGALLRLSQDGRRIEKARVALSAVAPTPLRARAAEECLEGAPPDPELFERAARLAQEAASPISDVRGSADYRRHLVRVLVRRALSEALRRAGAAGAGGERGVAIGG